MGKPPSDMPPDRPQRGGPPRPGPQRPGPGGGGPSSSSWTRWAPWILIAVLIGGFLLLNVAVGGTFPGAPDATTTYPQEMVVDYVRVS